MPGRPPPNDRRLPRAAGGRRMNGPVPSSGAAQPRESEVAGPRARIRRREASGMALRRENCGTRADVPFVAKHGALACRTTRDRGPPPERRRCSMSLTRGRLRERIACAMQSTFDLGSGVRQTAPSQVSCLEGRCLGCFDGSDLLARAAIPPPKQQHLRSSASPESCTARGSIGRAGHVHSTLHSRVPPSTEE